ncbi:MAG: carbohydrate ABC transporter permease [Planctomycetota bacterium]
MPVIAQVGRKALRVRALIIAIYLVLILGSVTTVYPFWLMLTGSVSSNHSEQDFSLLPPYLYDERRAFEALLFLKYYRYGGLEDIEYQWKVTVAGTYGRVNRWQLVPGILPTPDAPISTTLVTRACVTPYEQFRLYYEDIGSPKEWNASFDETVNVFYPLAVDRVRSFVEAHTPFSLEREPFLMLLQNEYRQALGRFAKSYAEAGSPPLRSEAFEELARSFGAFVTPHLREVFEEYRLCHKPDLSDPRVLRIVDDYLDFLPTLPMSHRDAYYMGGRSRTFEGDEDYRKWLHARYGSLDALNRAYRSDIEAWVGVFVPYDWLNRRSRYVENSPEQRDWNEYKAALPAGLIRPAAIEYWWSKFLEKRHGYDIANLNAAYAAQYIRFFDVPLAERPPENAAARADWEDYVRNELPLRFMRFENADALWRAFLLERMGTLEVVNRTLNRSYARADDIVLPFRANLQGEPYANEPLTFEPDLPTKYVGYPPTKRENNLVLDFVATKLPLESIRVVTVENLYRRWLLEKYETLDAVNAAYGTDAHSAGDFYLPMPITDWKELSERAGHIKWYTFIRAYKTAVNHIVRQRRSLWNTAVYCAAVVLAALVVNPMCAYALSRFNLPGAYRILLFLLATMAFPAEVTMIPNFLLLKSFPLLRIACTLGGFFVGGILATTLVPSKRVLYPLLGALVGALLGATVVTEAALHVAGITGNVSLLNTYWALILPGVASGYSIFILKGFFDSLPQELYEAAVIDGASETRIFVQVALPMSKPVLAVIALWGFTAAYGSFTWALIICQDPKMWTLMVHLYQYQMLVDPSERLSSLVLASIPTLIVFIAVQRIILKGIIIPTYK